MTIFAQRSFQAIESWLSVAMRSNMREFISNLTRITLSVSIDLDQCSAAAGLRSWSARAISSFLVPDSPRDQDTRLSRGYEFDLRKMRLRGTGSQPPQQRFLVAVRRCLPSVRRVVGERLA